MIYKRIVISLDHTSLTSFSFIDLYRERAFLREFCLETSCIQ